MHACQIASYTVSIIIITFFYFIIFLSLFIPDQVNSLIAEIIVLGRFQEPLSLEYDINYYYNAKFCCCCVFFVAS